MRQSRPWTRHASLVALMVTSRLADGATVECPGPTLVTIESPTREAGHAVLTPGANLVLVATCGAPFGKEPDVAWTVALTGPQGLPSCTQVARSLDEGRSLTVPLKVAAGRYHVVVSHQPVGHGPTQYLPLVNNEILVVARAIEPVAIEKAPSVVYPDDSSSASDQGARHFSLSLEGSGMGDAQEPPRLVIDGRQMEACPATQPACATLESHSTPKLAVWGIWMEGGGARRRSVQVKVGDSMSAAVSLTFAAVDNRWLGRCRLILCSFLFLFLWIAIGTPFAREFLLRDDTTNTLSLGRLQFLLWTSTILATYGYLVVTYVRVQGRFVLPAIPDNVLPLILITATGSVLSEAINRRGPGGKLPAKGFGSGIREILTANGRTAALDRIQLLVWTLAGVVGFLVMALGTDPSDTSDLPVIPGNLLLLMGVSTGVYSAGKLIRIAPAPPAEAASGAANQQGSTQAQANGAPAAEARDKRSPSPTAGATSPGSP